MKLLKYKMSEETKIELNENNHLDNFFVLILYKIFNATQKMHTQEERIIPWILFCLK